MTKKYFKRNLYLEERKKKRGGNFINTNKMIFLEGNAN